MVIVCIHGKAADVELNVKMAPNRCKKQSRGEKLHHSRGNGSFAQCSWLYRFSVVVKLLKNVELHAYRTTAALIEWFGYTVFLLSFNF